MQECLILWEDILFFRGEANPNLKIHKHHAIQLVISPDFPFFFKNNAGKWVERSTLFIAPDTLHQCRPEKGRIFTIKIEPESIFGERIMQKVFEHESIIDLSQLSIAAFIDKLEALTDDEQFNLLKDCIYTFLQKNFQLEAHQTKMDLRIQRVVSFIKANYSENISTKDLMGLVYLSESRLLHLFKEQVGIPVRHFILWQKLRRALEEMLSGKNLTESAHCAGFADSAHFSRTFQKTFGIPPSQLFQNSNSVQVFLPAFVEF